MMFITAMKRVMVLHMPRRNIRALPVCSRHDACRVSKPSEGEIMMNVPRIAPLHHSYPRPQIIASRKKENLEQNATFKELLMKKMKQKQQRE